MENGKMEQNHNGLNVHCKESYLKMFFFSDKHYV